MTRISSNARSSAAMKATNGAPGYRPVSSIYHQAEAHLPSYDAAKKAEYTQERRRKQNRDSSTDTVHRINIAIVEGKISDLTIVVAFVKDPKAFCKYFGLAHAPKQWCGGIFSLHYVKKPARLQAESSHLTKQDAAEQYYRHLNARIATILRTIRYLQCPGEVNGKVRKPSFKFVFKSDLPWMAPTIANRAKLRPKKLKKKHEASERFPSKPQPDTPPAQMVAYHAACNRKILDFHNMLAKKGTGAYTNPDKGSSRYAPSPEAISIGQTIRKILYTFNTSFDAHTVKELHLVLPREFPPVCTKGPKRGFFCSQLRQTRDKSVSKDTRKALYHFSRAKRTLKRVKKAQRGVIASTLFLQILAKANVNPDGPWPDWVKVLRHYFVQTVGSNEVFSPKV